MTDDCNNLDAYLDGSFSPGESARFAAHLAGCPACREAVDEQRWIDGLLREPAIAQREVPPAALVESVRGALARRLQFTRVAFGGAVAAAAMLLVAIGWAVKLNRQADGARDLTVSGVAAVEREDEVLPRATVVGGTDLIVVPVASRHPEVTVVRIYPAYRPSVSDQAGTSLQSVDGEFVWPERFNGG